MHRLVLSATSPYFRALLSGLPYETDKNVITIEGVTGQTLQALFEYCYIGKIGRIGENAVELLAAASRMDIAGVRELCDQHYRQALSLDTCLGTWQLAEKFNLQQLKLSAYAMVMESFRQLIRGSEFLRLNIEGLQRLLADDELFVHSEEDIFYALVAWIHFEVDKRKKYFVELIKMVRFEQLDSAVS